MSKSLLELKSEILESAKKKKSEILDEVQQETEKILSQAKQKAEEINLKMINDAKAQASTIRAQELSKTRSRIKMSIQIKKQEFVEKVYTEGFNQLQKIIDSKDYDLYLQRLAIDAGVALLGGELEIFTRDQDKGKIDIKTIFSEIKAKTGQESSITLKKITKETMGGCLVKKGNVWVDNTIEAVFERKKRDLRLDLAKILFEGGN
ncbi:MAG: V-type ATP synthase subunit E [Candidatus Hermodarchaeota archaeon]